MELMTIQETARILKISPITVRRYIAAARLPAVRVGKGVRIRKGDIEKLPIPIEVETTSKGAKQGKIFAKDDPLWNLVGIASSKGPTDVSENKQKYLAQVYGDLHNRQ